MVSVRQFQQAGGQSIYVVVGLADVHIGGGPLVIATMRPGQQPEKVERLVRDHLQQFGGDQLDVQRKGDVVLIGMKATVARYAALKSAARNDLIEPLTKLTSEGVMAAAVFCPGPDFRRVVRELWPELPGVLAPLQGELVDRWLRFELAVNPPPNARPRLALVSQGCRGGRDVRQIVARPSHGHNPVWRQRKVAPTSEGLRPASGRFVAGEGQRNASGNHWTDRRSTDCEVQRSIRRGR